MKCFVCGNTTGFKPLFPEFCEAKNYLCLGCSLIFISRDTSAQEYYKEDGYFVKSPNVGLRKHIVSPALLKKLGEDRFERIDKVLEHDFSGRRVLDVGCGYGQVLYALKNKYGADVVGLEPSREAARYGKSIFNIDIENSLLEEYKCKEKFDVAFCTHVLEHVNDPEAFLKGIKNLIIGNGAIYIEVPNIFKPTGRFKLNAFLYSEHLQTFSPYTLGKLLNKVGIRVDGIYDQECIRAICSIGGGNSVGIPNTESSEVLDFLEDYKSSYSFVDYVYVYSRKLLYLIKVIAYKFLGLVK